MSALDELRNKDTSRITHLDFVILAYPEKEQIHIGDADISIAAAAELAALRQKLETQTKYLKRIAACKHNPDPFGYLPALAQEALDATGSE